MVETRTYELRVATIADFKAALDDIRREAAGSEGAAKWAAAGVDPNAARDIQAEQGPAGFTGAELILLKLLSAAALKAFEVLVLPEIKRRLDARRPEDIKLVKLDEISPEVHKAKG